VLLRLAAKLSANAIRMIEGKNFASLATLLPDGSPHVTPMWVDHEGDIILMNTAEGRIKLRNIARDPRVAVAITDHNNPYDRVVIKGQVIARMHEGAEAHIDKLAKKYTGANKYQRSTPDEKRVIIKIEPIKVL
jgi:PPOX class probable F420-dependent enzyme